MVPSINTTGENTTTSTSVIARAVNPISFRPSKAAFFRSLPIWRCRYMFSKTTIESSTRIPITNDIAKSVIRFNVYPNKYMATNVEIRDAGIEINTINAFLKLCRNNSITAATSKTASSRSWITASTDSIVGIEVSVATVKTIPLSAYFFSISLNFFLVAFAMSTAFASLCFLILKPIPF